ncbi:hypothetical protein BYT27DRAFT_7221801 [Phlegmacium glaucopus]|nr:hypothetical protein BYT27DRAFT_7221801 [Phlegmacium glaucopus]
MPPVHELQCVELSKYKMKTNITRAVYYQHLSTFKNSQKNAIIRIPQVLDVFTIRGTVHIIQEYIHGPVLEDMWRHLSPEEQRSSMVQLKDCLDQLHALKPLHPERLQAVEWAHRRPSGVHATFHWFLSQNALRALPESYYRVQEALFKTYGQQYKILFSHGDLGPHNILWKERSNHRRVHAARDDMKGWWVMFKETLD